MIIDTHAHYDDEAFDADREALLASMHDGGIEKIVNVCASVDGLHDTVELMEKYPFIYGAVGVHPDDADKMTQETLDEIRRLSCMDKMVAIGEIGLDYYWHKGKEEHEIQQKMFRAQLDIAREEKMPFMIHSRDAAEDTLNIIREYMQGGMYGGIIHCFSYSREIAAEYLKMGLYLGIGGVVTFQNAKKVKETVQLCAAVSACAGNGQPVPGSEAEQREEKFFSESALCGTGNRRVERDYAEEVIEVTRQNAERLLGL
mgnify:CR=1 FL=1